MDFFDSVADFWADANNLEHAYRDGIAHGEHAAKTGRNILPPGLPAHAKWAWSRGYIDGFKSVTDRPIIPWTHRRRVVTSGAIPRKLISDRWLKRVTAFADERGGEVVATNITVEAWVPCRDDRDVARILEDLNDAGLLCWPDGR